MALKVNLMTGMGLAVIDGHAVIKEIATQKETRDGKTTFRVIYGGLVWLNEETYKEEKSPVEGFNCFFELDVGNKKNHHNIWKQCYLHLKEQKEFSSVSDC